eukprot:COSAG02_NODE_1317_length_13295_cov_6.434071_4_plen_273_part_00
MKSSLLRTTSTLLEPDLSRCLVRGSKPQRKPPGTIGGAYAPSTEPPAPSALAPSPPRCPPGSSSAIASSSVSKSTAVDSVTTWVLRLSRDKQIAASHRRAGLLCAGGRGAGWTRRLDYAIIQERQSVGMVGQCSWARTPVLLLAVACSATVCAAQERYEWQCTQVQQAAPCMSDVACPIEDISKATCQRLCEEAQGCTSIVYESAGGLCYLKEERDGAELGAESCVRNLQMDDGDDGEWDAQERWSTSCVLWGAGCTPASPLPWLMALFFGM